MPKIRKIYNAGQAAVVNVGRDYLEMCRMEVGSTAEVSCHTIQGLLRDVGIVSAVIDQIPLTDEHFILIREHKE